MKKLFVVFLAISVLLMTSVPAFALQCKAGQGPEESDECWTEVEIDAGYPYLVSRGHVLAVSYDNGTGITDVYGRKAKHPYVSTDAVLGVAQKNIASGSTSLILAKGFGVINTAVWAGGITSGDALAVTATSSRSAVSGDVIKANTAHLGRQRIATSLETQSSTDATNKAYINVL